MKPLLAFVVSAVVSSLLHAAAPAESAAKRVEVLKLIHTTKELRQFKEDVTRTVDGVRQAKPEMPAWFWEELEREVSADAYAQWLVEIYERVLSLGELRELNLMFGEPKKKALIDGLIEKLAGKQGDDFISTVQEFRRANERDTAEEIIRFIQSSAAANYGTARTEISTGTRDTVIRLLVAADGRVRARHR